MNTHRLTIQILGGARENFTRETWADPRQVIKDPFSRLYIMEEGKAHVTLAGVTHVLEPGRLYLIPGGRAGHYVCPVAMRLCWLHARVETIPLIDIFSRWDPPFSVALTDAMSQAMNECVALFSSSRSPAATFQQTALACQLFSHFLPRKWEELIPSSDQGDRFRPVLTLMQQSMDRPLSLNELAQEVHLHPTYLSNLFKDTFGVSPVAYHMELRLHRAKMLLVDTALPVAQVAAACGFSDEFNFSKTFKRRVGYSPRDFRREGGPVMLP